jgi:hypothetical protein
MASAEREPIWGLGEPPAGSRSRAPGQGSGGKPGDILYFN